MIIRRLLFMERPKAAAHLMRLGAEDRMMRFEAAQADEAIAQYVARIPMGRDVLIGAFCDDLSLRGLAHVALAGEIADIGLSVEQAFRGQGVGSQLLVRAIREARLRHMKMISSQCLTHNRWIIRKMRALGCAIQTDLGTTFATAPVDPPDLGLIGAAVFEENIGWIDYGAKMLLRLTP
jgi:GNAT superfamily N-acetyltransferase